MAKKAKKALALLLCFIMLTGIIAVPASAATGSKGTISSADISAILNAETYKEYGARVGTKRGSDTIVIDATQYDADNTTAQVEVKDNHYGNKGLLSPDAGTVSWTFNVSTAGRYVIELEYCQAGDGKKNSIERIFYLNGEIPFSEARSIVLGKNWVYNYHTGANGEQTFQQDTNGNDIRPSVTQDPIWQKYVLSDSDGYYINPLEFYLDAGENTISFESTRESVIIKSITVRPYTDLPTYQEYLQKHGDPATKKPSATSVIKIEAEKADAVSHVTIYPVSDNSSPLTSGITGAQAADVTKYNTTGGTQWQNVGEWIDYKINVPETGYYKMAFRYKQNTMSGMYVSRRVYIDGQIPFAEASLCRFEYDSSWKMGNLNDGEEEFQFYFEKGEHTVRFEVSLGEMGAYIQSVSDSLYNINNCYLEILKLTGSNPDEDRTYGFRRIMPDVLNTMMKEALNLEIVFNYLVETVGKGEKTATLEQLIILLKEMASDEEEIAPKLERLKTQIGSLGTWINSAKTQPLLVDYILIQSADNELPKADGNFFQKAWYEIKLFFASFYVDYNSLSVVSSDSGVVTKGEPIEVWVVTGRDQAQIIRNLIDNDFTPNTGISTNLKLISAGTLLPSVLAGVGPDVSLFEASNNTIDYALRSAVMPLNTFIEADLAKGDDVLAYFPEAAMVPLTLYNYDIETGVTSKTYYGLPDSLSFPMMFYRKDILASLGLDIPQTWDDLLSMIPVLQYNNMEIGIDGVKDGHTFIYQSGYDTYADEGMRINFDETGVLNAFVKLCNMYTQYALPYTYDFANRFRTGEMPIGIAPYTTCNQLAVFASELSGLWGFVPLPGFEINDENGNPYVNNCALAGVSSCVMINNDAGSKDAIDYSKYQNAWDFMKWYAGKDFQVAYSNEVVSIRGIAARPATANSEAIMELPWTTEEAENILAQFGNLEAVPNHPGSYYLARYINFAILAAVNDGKDPADELLSYVTTINKEITRRRKEFGMDYLEVGTTLEEYLESLKSN